MSRYPRRATSPFRSVRVYVGNLPRAAGVRDVEHFFRRYRRRFDVLLKDRFGFIVSWKK